MAKIYIVAPDAPPEAIEQLKAERTLGSGIRLGVLDNSKGNADHLLDMIVAGVKKEFKVDSVVFKLRSSEGFEYNYRIEKGGGLLYAWTATRPVKYEFHGEHDGAGLGVAVSYEKAEGSRGSGSFVAPSSGIHGWYWENTSDEEMTITLTSSGFYSWADEFRQRFDPVKHKGVVDRIRHELSEPAESR